MRSPSATHLLHGDSEIRESGGESGHRIEEWLATGRLPWPRGVVDDALSHDFFQRGRIARGEGLLEAAYDIFFFV